MLHANSTAVTIALLLASATVGASEIYRWTDEDGVVHFSDTAPGDTVESVTLYVRDTNPPDYDPDADPYSVRNQAERTSAYWAEFEKARDEREAARREQQERAQRYEPRYDHYRYYYGPAYLPHPVHFRPHRPGLARRQAMALEETGLAGPRPHSINSGAHRARVETSQSLPLVRPKRR